MSVFLFLQATFLRKIFFLSDGGDVEGKKDKTQPLSDSSCNSWGTKLSFKKTNCCIIMTLSSPLSHQIQCSSPLEKEGGKQSCLWAAPALCLSLWPKQCHSKLQLHLRLRQLAWFTLNLWRSAAGGAQLSPPLLPPGGLTQPLDWKGMQEWDDLLNTHYNVSLGGALQLQRDFNVNVIKKKAKTKNPSGAMGPFPPHEIIGHCRFFIT